ncbi:hypothetical protein KIPB_008228, partial [Kipferlia bialata]
NSWGNAYGEDGYFKTERGVDVKGGAFAIETMCHWATIIDPKA